MARVFISHSSVDKPFARRLAQDLTDLGHSPWLDEYDIRVGDSIPAKIEEGLEASDFVVVVLSPEAVQSGWVDNEWKAKYWDEVRAGSAMVLPALLRDCEIPMLLRPKKYADFRKYAVGLVQLADAIAPTGGSLAFGPNQLPMEPRANAVADLVEKVQGRTASLSQCFAEALQLAIRLQEAALELFCRTELQGWRGDLAPDQAPKYRLVELLLSPEQINMNYMGFGGSASNALAYMRRTDGFVPHSMVVGESISQLEARPAVTDPDKGLLVVNMPWSAAQEDAPHPNATIYGYAAGDSYSRLLERIRTELTSRLLNLLPPVQGPVDSST